MGNGSDSPSTGRTRKIKFQTPSESIDVEQYGQNTVALLDRVDVTEQHNKSCFYLRGLRVCVVRNEPPQHHAKQKANFLAVQ